MPSLNKRPDSNSTFLGLAAHLPLTYGHQDMLDPNIPLDLQDLISRELLPDENVVWNAMSKPQHLSQAALLTFYFGLCWAVMCVMWWLENNQGSDMFPLSPIPCVLIGIGMLSSPLWGGREKSKAVYLITDRRAITIEGGRTSTIRSYLPENLKDIFRREHTDGTGDVLIARNAWKGDDGITHIQDLGFLRIENAKSVETMLNAMAEQCDLPTSPVGG